MHMSIAFIYKISLDFKILDIIKKGIYIRMMFYIYIYYYYIYIFNLGNDNLC